MAVVFHRYGQMVAVCVDCHSGLTIPAAAREVGRLKREKKWQPKEPSDEVKVASEETGKQLRGE